MNTYKEHASTGTRNKSSLFPHTAENLLGETSGTNFQTQKKPKKITKHANFVALSQPKNPFELSCHNVDVRDQVVGETKQLKTRAQSTMISTKREESNSHASS